MTQRNKQMLCVALQLRRNVSVCRIEAVFFFFKLSLLFRIAFNFPFAGTKLWGEDLLEQ